MSEAVKKMFTDISQTYDKLNRVLSLRIDQSWRKKAIKKINKDPNQSFKVLDLCAGTHDFGLQVRKLFPNAQIYAADFSLGMLKAGQKKIKNAKNFIFPLCADALHLPFADNQFDVILCAYGIRNLDNTFEGLKELKRVLHDSGQLIVLEFFKPTSQTSKFFHSTYAKFLMPKIGKWISGNESAYQYLKNSIQGFLTLNEFKDLMKKVGFNTIQDQEFLMNISSCVWGKI